MIITKWICSLVIGATVLCACGCSKEDDGPSGPAKVKEIRLSESRLDLTSEPKDIIKNLQYTLLPDNAEFTPLEFTIDNTSVAQVLTYKENEDGLRSYGVGVYICLSHPGTATLTISTPDKSVQAQCVITVTDPAWNDDDDIAKFLEPQFVSYLNGLGYDEGGHLRYGIAKAITEIPSDGNLNIGDFSSLRFFKSLKKLGDPAKEWPSEYAYINSDCDFSYIPNIESIAMYMGEESKVFNLSAAPALSSLKLNQYGYDLDITDCQNLESLDIQGLGYIREDGVHVNHRVNVAGLEQARNLKYLSLYTFNHETLDFSHNPNLEYVNITDGACRSINLHGASKLHHLVLSNATAISSIDITGTPLGLDVNQDSGFVPLYIDCNQNPQKEFIIYVTPEQYKAYENTKIEGNGLLYNIFEYSYDYDLYMAGERMKIVVVDN